jgi:2-haloacid dehalogenase
MMRKINRKTFIQTSGLVTASMVMNQAFNYPSNSRRIKALAFDAFAIFDPRPILKTVEGLFAENAKQIIEVWQSRQFTYQWLRLLGHRYKNFWDVTRDALDFALLQCRLSEREKEIDLLMAGYKHMQAWPDVIPALQQIKEEKVKVCFLSNMTLEMLHQGIRNSKLNEYFDYVISTDETQTYKPSPNAYQMAVQKLKLGKEQILFVPFAGWDMAGAKWFGYPTFWLNRLNSPGEELSAEPDGKGTTLNDVLEFVRKSNG